MIFVDLCAENNVGVGFTYSEQDGNNLQEPVTAKQ